ncbi:MAG TPA: SDR family oxidoreductase [Candidatus Binatia bacterium]|jgi:NAD(P)-dependent dehydrogenase (short-subunit alcohol dehydrogenase family)|nr:SDR family oxidoreductase [Candidatus Binatia bacterium]
MRLEGKIAVITGGGTGIGKQTGLLFAQEGADLVVLGPRADELELVRKEVQALSRRCVVHKVDVANEREVDDTIKASLKSFSRIDLLINNAAVFRSTTAPVAELGLQAWNEEIAVNLTGSFLCCKAVMPGMIERKSGKIINISSVAAQRAYPLRSPYAVSKAGLIALTRTLAAEVGSYNVRVNAIAPGPVSGNRMKRIIEARARSRSQSIAETEEDYLRSLALGRMVEEEDVARMALFLASKEGDNITGQVFNVCSGYKL